MALIKPEQLRSGSYSITGSFSGSFFGNLQGTALYAKSAEQISLLNITASVATGSNVFLITSGSSELFLIDNKGSVTISSDAENVFLIKNVINSPILTVSQSGVLILATQSVELNGPAPNGGIYFTSSSFFVGLD